MRKPGFDFLKVGIRINKKRSQVFQYLRTFGGELGIRTPGPFNKSTVFKTAAIDHSANSPGTKVQNHAELPNLILSFFNKDLSY
jgi:hypothetical protein